MKIFCHVATLLFLQLTVFSLQAPTETSISGRVTGPTGQPLVGMQVWLFRPELDLKAQKVLWKSVTTVTTNDRGEYRHFGLAPGRYYLGSGSINPALGSQTVAAQARRLQVAGVSTENRRYVTSFYPNTPDTSNAMALDLKMGSELKGIDFALKELRTFAIRGTFADADGAVPAGARVTATISIAMRDIAVSQNSSGVLTRIPPNDRNTFEIADVAPGRYWVGISLSTINGTPPPLPQIGPRDTPATPEEEAAMRRQLEAVLASSAVSMKRGLVAVDVVDRDVDGVVVVARRGALVDGRIAVEGQEWAAVQGRERIRIVMRPPVYGLASAGGVTGAPAMEVRPDGSFGSRAISPFDDYRLAVTDLPEDVYVKGARFGSTDILGKSFPISGPTSDRVEVVLSPKGGRIEGNSVPNATVVLVPQSRLERPDLFRIATADASGRFALRGLAPGVYILFAFERPTDSYLALEHAGMAVQVSESSRATVNLPLS